MSRRDHLTPRQRAAYERKVESWPLFVCQGRRGKCGFAWNLRPGRRWWCGVCGSNEARPATDAEVQAFNAARECERTGREA